MKRRDKKNLIQLILLGTGLIVLLIVNTHLKLLM